MTTSAPSFQGLSSAALSIWAKSDRDTLDGTWNPLIAHMLDVAACAEAILALEPESTRQLYLQDWGLSSWAELRPWLLALIGMHDLGKAAPVFQNLWPAGTDHVEAAGLKMYDYKRLLLNADKRGGKYAGFGKTHHGFISQEVLERLLKKAAWPRKSAQLAADAVGAHHGWRALPTTLKGIQSRVQDTGNNAWEKVRQELFEAMLATLGAEHLAPPPMERIGAGAYVRLAGLTSFTDWIGSNLEYFPFVARELDLQSLAGLKDYYAKRLEQAADSLTKLGWTQRLPLAPTERSFREIFGNAPRPLQEQVAHYAETADQPVLLLIEGPMGEGKTEAAFFAHLLLQKRLGHRGMYLALPTQATGNAMFKRALEFLENQGHTETIDLQLAHGAALLNNDYQNLRQARIFAEEDEAESHDTRIRSAEWFTHKKRALLSEYGVGTVDQALMGILRVRHFFVRLWGLGNRTVVIDEVHAYDTYTSTLIERLISWLHALGASVIVMSATLPASRRKAMLQAYGASNEPVIEMNYPRIYRVMKGKIEGHTFATEPSRTRDLQIRSLSPEIDVLAEKALELVANGGCLGCIVNTVDRAQQLYLAIQQRNPEVELHLFHARYPARQRQEIEDVVLQKFGLQPKDGPSQRPRQAILVATQVVEQSLDLDFDVLISDLAPIDLLLQRAGREHRHLGNPRYEHTVATLYISGLALHDREVPNWREPLFWEVLYEKEVLIYTQYFLQDLLQNNKYINLPGDIDRCIQAVYDEPLELPYWLQTPAEKAENKSLIQRSMDRNTAKDAMIGHPDTREWEIVMRNEKLDPEDNPDVHQGFWARTRLGDEALAVIPLVKIKGNLALHVSHIGIEITPGQRPSSAQAKDMYMQHAKLSNKDVVAHLRDSEHPDAPLIAQVREDWCKNPLLRNCYPLLLDGDSLVLKKLTLHWNPELGIVYQKSSQPVKGAHHDV